MKIRGRTITVQNDGYIDDGYIEDNCYADWLMGNEVDAIVTRAIADKSSDDKDVDLYRSIVLKGFKALHADNDTFLFPLHAAKGWKEAERALSPAEFAHLKELIRTDIEEIMALF